MGGYVVRCGEKKEWGFAGKLYEYVGALLE